MAIANEHRRETEIFQKVLTKKIDNKNKEIDENQSLYAKEL